MPRDIDKALQAAVDGAREGFAEQGFEPAALTINVVIPGDEPDSFDYTAASSPDTERLLPRHRELLQNSLTASAVELEA